MHINKMGKTTVMAAVFTASAALGMADTLRWASKTDPDTMDPHAGSSAPVLSFLNNVYEGLVRRGRDMSIEPSLALSLIHISEPTRPY